MEFLLWSLSGWSLHPKRRFQHWADSTDHSCVRQSNLINKNDVGMEKVSNIRAGFMDHYALQREHKYGEDCEKSFLWMWYGNVAWA